MSITVVGTMAFDAIETPFDKTDKIIGGSATYVAYAAANFVQPVQQISIVGYDFPQEELDELQQRGVKTNGVKIVPDKKSFFWSGRYHLDMNSRDTLVTDLNVLADFDPQVPENYQDCKFLMLGNLVPAIQQKVIEQFKKRPKLIVLDTMNFWIETAWEDLKKVFTMVDVLLVNDSEARQISGEYSLVKAAKKILKMGPKFLKPRFNICFSDFFQTVRAKFFNTKTRHGRTYNNGCFHIFKRDIFCFGQMPDKATCKAVACARWIKHFFQW